VGVPEPPAPVEPSPAEAVTLAEPPAPEVPAPSGIRVSTRTTIVYAAPRYGSEMRGRIDRGAPFAIYGLVEGSGCDGEGWARAGHREGDGFVCLKSASATEAAPQVLPIVPEGQVVPFIYAKPKADRKGKLLAEVPRWRTRHALTSGREPEDYLEANRQYAFVDLRPIPGHGKIYEDADERVVLARDMRPEQPSDFHGRVLAERPIAEGRMAAWVSSREAEMRAEPKASAPVAAVPAFHAELDALAEIQQVGRRRWVVVPDALGPGVPGYIETTMVRMYEPGPALDDIGDEETWVDVDVGQQTLAVMQGQRPIFVTLISSGTGSKPNTATPRGVYRIRNKVAFGAMRNRPEDAEESPYHVEAVPWVQYFYRRFALHGAYWHDGFGHRKSHGCVNLAPRDARYVYGLTTPNVPPGWMSSYEHAGEIGSVVRVRKGQELGEDRRQINDVEQDAAAAADTVLADGAP
jgi:lipoprotein-anchoring transpeptidase ErfK/SrfK